jgi:hypothetical protein
MIAMSKRQATDEFAYSNKASNTLKDYDFYEAVQNEEKIWNI